MYKLKLSADARETGKERFIGQKGLKNAVLESARIRKDAKDSGNFVDFENPKVRGNVERVKMKKFQRYPGIS